MNLSTCGPKVFYYFRYSTVEMKNTVVTALIVLVAIFVLYQYDSTLFGLLGREGFEDAPTSQAMAKSNDMNKGPAGGPAPGASPGAPQKKADEKPAAKPLPGNPQSAGAAGNELKTQPGAKKEGFADLASYEGPADFASVDAPAGCYPRDQLTPSELLPLDQNSIWAQQNPMGPGSLKGKNFLSAGALIGVNTVGQSLRNANLQIRSEPPNPQIPVSIFLQSTIGPDISHRPLEIGA
jgi:hypothetical protein